MSRLATIRVVGVVTLASTFAFAQDSDWSTSLLDDNFDDYPYGLLFSDVGAHAEYHYVPETAPKGPWSVSTYLSGPETQRAWRVLQDNGIPVMAQTCPNKRKQFHPMLSAGDPLWQEYELQVEFAPQAPSGRSGVAFRCRNDRCYYFFGVDGPRAVLLLVRHGKGFQEPYEEILAEGAVTWEPGQYLEATVRIEGSRIRAELDPGVVLESTNDAYPTGGIALLADAPTYYDRVVVRTRPQAADAWLAAVQRREDKEQALQEKNPRPALWCKVNLKDFGVGRNLRFGDLDGDGTLDMLVGQVIHHGPKDRNSELSCLTALSFDGKQLWQVGVPDPWKDHLTNDVAFQIHDLDGDGRNEAVYCMNMEIIVADGATGKVKYKAPTPETPPNTEAPYNKFPRILGDSLLFCDLRGQGRPADIILKDRYRSLWALNDRLEILWHAQCNTGHFPFAYDVDKDGKDELLVGYSLLDDNGKRLWSLDDTLKDHSDGAAIVQLRPGAAPHIFCAGSDEGALLIDLQGNILKHHYIGHVQNPATADFRPDLPGLETVTVNFWGNQGIIHFFNADAEAYHDFEPFQHGSMCLPVNWTGRPGEYVMLSANVDDGGLFDGWGRRVVSMPADGHPDMCYAVLDITGDCRDELVVWDPSELWVYTQDDSPLPGPLYKPFRNPLYNYSNYQASVSLPPVP